MSDIFSKAQRSQIMSRVRSKGNAATEMRLAALLRSYKVKGWRRNYKMFGNPDFAFPREKLAVFVDGEFWHGHPTRGQVPKTNVEFWVAKIQKNRERDRLVDQTLRSRGWKVVRIWQHELRDAERCIDRVRKGLESQ